MCDFCVQYGEGTVWHQNPKNYARRMYSDRRKKADRPAGPPPEVASQVLHAQLFAARNDEPEKVPEIRAELVELIAKTHGGQVVTLDEAKEMVDLASPIALMGCVCRRVVRGKVEKRHEFTCMGLGVGMFKWDRWPERYKGGVEFVTPKEAKKWLDKWNKAGYVQTLMIFDAPYIGGICNCDYPTCLAIRYRMDYRLDSFMVKGHYVAKVDLEECNGCGRCFGRCQFGALTKEIFEEKAYVDAMKCFGCGVCQTSCNRDAIALIEKSTWPAMEGVW
ncbi:MAG: 4Fe-4S binding protein [Actinomycetota bacterium]